MSHVDVVRAWKDEAYRLSLSEAERAALPPNPAGLIELAEADLDNVSGGSRPRHTRHRCHHTRHRCGGSTRGSGRGCGGGGGTGTGTGGNCTRCVGGCR
jgi:mersacidin/lichenicidin family type 2 lantibiotic